MRRLQLSSRLSSPLAGAVSLAVLLTAAAPATARAAEAVQETFEKTFEVTGISHVRLQNVNGSVRVSSWDKPAVQVSAVKKARGSRAEQIVRETEIRVTRSGGNLDIETVPPKVNRFLGLFSFGDGQRAEVTYELSLPPGLAVDVETVNGRIVAERRTGALTLNTVNGAVKVEAQDGPLRVNAVNGSVEVGFVGTMRASDLETVNGSVSVSCRRDSSIRYQLATVNGKIRSDFPDVNVEGRWGPKEARGSINGGRERLAVETVNGEVRLAAVDLPPVPATGAR